MNTLNIYLNKTGYTAKIGSTHVVRDLNGKMYDYTDFWRHKSSIVKEEDVDAFVKFAASENINVILHREIK